MFGHRVLRRKSGPKRNEITRELRKLHNEELDYLYSSSKIVKVIKSRRMRWAGHVARMGVMRGLYRGNMKERDELEDTGVDGRIILRWIFKKWHVCDMNWIELPWDWDTWRALVNALMNILIP
jgi:hypothetical protein